MDIIEKKISNLIQAQFPQFYQTDGPVFVQFVKAYYQWLETQQTVNNFTFSKATVNVRSTNNTIIGTNSYFTDRFANGDSIALWRSNNDYQIYTINTVSNNTIITLTETPSFSNNNTYFSNTILQHNPLYHSRRAADYRDVDNSTTQFLKYIKEKYLKGIQYSTRSNTRQMIKHALDIYRSKGSERSVDLLFRLVFGVGAEVYYPSSDLFQLSAGKWNIPKYLELTLSDDNVRFVNKQIYGLSSGAVAFVEKVIRRTVKGHLSDIAYISPINGDFQTGELIDTEDNQFAIEQWIRPAIKGSLTLLQVDTLGSGSNFEIGDIVSLSSPRGGEGYARVVNVTSTSGLVSFTLANGGYGYANTAQVLVSEKVLTIDQANVDSTVNSTVYFYPFELIKQPKANIVYTTSNGVTANLTGTVAFVSGQSNVVGTSTTFDETFINGDYVLFWTNSTSYFVKRISAIANDTHMSMTNSFSSSNSSANFAVNHVFNIGDNLTTYYSNGTVVGTGRVIDISRTNAEAGEITVSNIIDTLDFVGTPNANSAANIAFAQNNNYIHGVIPNANITGNVSIVQRKLYVTGDGTAFDKELVFPAANIAGTVAVNSSTTNVTGSGLTTYFSANQYITIYSNSTSYQTRRITSVTATNIVVDQAFTFSNGAANFTRGHINRSLAAYDGSAIEIRSINSIVNATYLTITDKFTFSNTITKASNTNSTDTQFFVPNANQTGTVSFSNNQTNVTGTSTTFQSSFIVGDHLALYINSTAYIIRTIESITSNTLLTLTTPIANSSNTTANFANISANASYTYGKRVAVYTNSTSFVVKSINNVVNATYLTFQNSFSSTQANSAAKFANCDISYYIYSQSNSVVANNTSYTDRTATGNVIAYADQMTINTHSLSADFTEEEQLYQVDGSNNEIANATLVTYTQTTGANGIIAVSNVVGRFRPNLLIRGRTSNSTANIVNISFKVGVINVTGTFTNTLYNHTVSEQSNTRSTTTIISGGTGATFTIDDLIYTENVTTCDYIIGDFANVGLDDLTYTFENALANLNSCTIYEALEFANTSFGKVYQISGIDQGEDYTTSPFIVIYQPFAYGLQKKDSYLYLNSLDESFAVGELVTQAATNGRGLVKAQYTTDLASFPGTTANTVAVLAIERLRLFDNSYFIPTINVTTVVIGANSGAAANIEMMVEDNASKYIGINANVQSNVVTANGAVTELEVVDSGFGFINGESIAFTSGNNSGNAIAIVSKQGKSRGLYTNKKGFLSDVSKLHDGWYYQQFSYDIISPLTIDFYRDMLNKTIHVAGTKMFGTYAYITVANSSVNIANTEIVIS